MQLAAWGTRGVLLRFRTCLLRFVARIVSSISKDWSQLVSFFRHHPTDRHPYSPPLITTHILRRTLPPVRHWVLAKISQAFEGATVFSYGAVRCGAVRCGFTELHPIGTVLLNRTPPYDFVFNKIALHRTAPSGYRKIRAQLHGWPRVVTIK